MINNLYNYIKLIFNRIKILYYNIIFYYIIIYSFIYSFIYIKQDKMIDKENYKDL